MAKLNNVLITVSNELTGDTYLTRSYPDHDRDNNRKRELYSTPVYKLYIEKISKLKGTKTMWKALRFYPYWNDPKAPDTRYKTRGWKNAGLWRFPKTRVSYYNRKYETHTNSPYRGAIQIKGHYLIHAGPRTLHEYAWGAAGCVEIIGDFNSFKEDIKRISGSVRRTADGAISELVRLGKLFVKIEYAKPPKFKNNFFIEEPY